MSPPINTPPPLPPPIRALNAPHAVNSPPPPVANTPPPVLPQAGDIAYVRVRVRGTMIDEPWGGRTGVCEVETIDENDRAINAGFVLFLSPNEIVTDAKMRVLLAARSGGTA